MSLLSSLRSSSLSTSRHSSSAQASCFSSTPNNLVWVQKKIQVKLRVDHPELGKAGRVIRVKPGHMRQRLYPSGQALYCAKDGIPFHHLQPSFPPSSPPIAPPPGLSRPIVELMTRLGVKLKLSPDQLKSTQEFRDQCIQEALGRPKLSNFTTPVNTPKPTTASIVPTQIPKGLEDELQRLTRQDRQPLLIFKRPCATDSENLYASIKLKEVLDQLFTLLQPRFKSEILFEILEPIGSNPIKNHDPIQGPGTLRPIKTVGDHLFTLGLGQSDDKRKTFEFIVRVEKKISS
ncbi:hypothetical protein CROQUDRAFT_661364 [Cronartium quercuum f. sp. fusiforme G11]|uniref:Ribosomal protein L9 domain-containing protein n=1 Tax=Cronartium quercuum f. sp. fusiforme G11 TaxID=708437 RepID=A0A9P6NB65_9BASI|nr:hypothetical protein CROQUDRAFT_661364 [Cronartium quercuum f. sp. fusiforme G11]